MIIYKINELFDSIKTYPYEFVERKKYKYKDSIIYLYTFISDDNTKYYVSLFQNDTFLSLEFADEKNYSKSKGKFTLTNKNDAINVLNTVIKISKDFMVEHPEIDEIAINTSENRLATYKYILKKYFIDWRMEINKKQKDRYDVKLSYYNQ